MVTEVPVILLLSAVEYSRKSLLLPLLPLSVERPNTAAGTADIENEREDTTKMADVKPLKELVLLIV